MADPDQSTWRITELGRLRLIFLPLTALAISMLGITTASCNLHELSHLIVSKSMGLEVLWVNWCIPGSGGEVKLAEVSPPFQAFAGGIGASAVLSLGYVALFMRLRLPYKDPIWYAVGLPILPLAAVQFLVGILEGTSPRSYGGDYGTMINSFPTVFIPLIVGTALAGGAIYVISWSKAFEKSSMTSSAD